MKSQPGSGAPRASEKQKWSKVRRFVRYRTDVRVVVRMQRGGESVPIYGRCTMVGAGGFGATLAGELEKGSRVEAELMLFGPDHTTLRAGAIVRYRNGFRHGFEFSDFGHKHRERIRELCRTLIPAD